MNVRIHRKACIRHASLIFRPGAESMTLLAFNSRVARATSFTGVIFLHNVLRPKTPDSKSVLKSLQSNNSKGIPDTAAFRVSFTQVKNADNLPI